MKSFRMDAFIKATMSMASLKESENINGLTDNFIKDSG